MNNWNIQDSLELYKVDGWSSEYFSINDKGHVQVSPRRNKGPSIDLKEVLDEVIQEDLNPPVLLRFPDILDDRIEIISQCFENAAKEYDYKGKYYSVYPIKVNQQRPVVEEIVRHGKKFNIGLEAGSKPELHAVLAVNDNPDAIIICNGYKDNEFIELALLAQKMGKPIYIVVEKLNELRLIQNHAERLNIRPNIGLRIRLNSSGSGKWEASGGDQSKFGLNASELMDAISMAKEANLLDCIKLIHFHLGSQITNIQKIKSGFQEVAHFYAQLYKLDCKPEFVDIGGGLGVDYDGSNSCFDHSVNYSIQEYANDAVYSLLDASNKHNIPQPNIISESGRALTAHHSILVFNVLETTSSPNWDEATRTLNPNQNSRVLELHELWKNLNEDNLLEYWHDAQRLRKDVLNLFSLGIISLEDRANGERLFWGIARKIHVMIKTMEDVPEELDRLPELLTEKYFCNFSLFQSLPDSWAIDQLFPIMPIHRLEEEPEHWATIQDITCDSDGKIGSFIGVKDHDHALLLHEVKPNEPYYLAVFLVGAYQEILGDLHNLFGDTNVAHISCKDDSYEVTRIIHGESVADVLDFVEYNPRELVRTMETWVNQSVKAGKLPAEQGKLFLATYTSGLYGYTYLEE